MLFINLGFENVELQLERGGPLRIVLLFGASMVQGGYSGKYSRLH